MDLKLNPESFHKINMLIWKAILAGMVLLGVVVFLLESGNTFTPVEAGHEIGKILYYVAIAVAIAILLFKRVLFVPERIVQDIQADKIFERIRSRYIIIWAMAEFIFMAGFIDYILNVQWNTFLLYAVIGIYALVINMPRQNFVQQCIEIHPEFTGRNE